MKKIIRISIIFLIMLLMVGCDSQNENLNKKPIIHSINENSDEIIHRAIEDENYILLDVRSKEEYEEYSIENSINIPYDVIESNLDKIDKSKTILVFCVSGKRASVATSILKNNGYKAYNVGSINNLDLEKYK